MLRLQKGRQAYNGFRGVSFVDCQETLVRLFLHLSLRCRRESHNKNVDILKSKYGRRIMIARPYESQLKLKVDFHSVPYNQTFDFVTGQFVKILSPDCSWKMSITLNRLEYFDKILHMHWYWRLLVQEIAKWHLSLVEALPSAKFWKSENSPISWTELNILKNFCVIIDIDTM